MGQYQDNQLQAAMMMRQYGLRPNMPGYGHQLNQLSSAMGGQASNTGQHEGGGYPVNNYDPFDNTHHGIPGEYTGPTNTGDSNPPDLTTPNPTTAPSDNTGFGGRLLDTLNNDFANSRLGRGVAGLRALFGGGNQRIPIPDQGVNLHELYPWGVNQEGVPLAGDPGSNGNGTRGHGPGRAFTGFRGSGYGGGPRGTRSVGGEMSYAFGNVIRSGQPQQWGWGAGPANFMGQDKYL